VCQHGLFTSGEGVLKGSTGLGMLPVVPPKSNRLSAWDYSKAMYKKRNEVERLFRRLKSFRPIVSGFDKLDCVFMFFIHFALITDAIISVNTPWRVFPVSSPQAVATHKILG
jgi:hypothetical protein